MSTPDFLLLSIVAFLLVDFSAGMVINFFNEQSKNQPMTPDAAQIYDASEYEKSVEYGTVKYKFEMISAVVSTVVFLSAIILGWFARLDSMIRENISNNMMVTIVFVGILILVGGIGSIPGSYYSTFIIEERFGFNKTTKKALRSRLNQAIIVKHCSRAPDYLSRSHYLSEVREQFLAGGVVSRFGNLALYVYFWYTNLLANVQ